MLSFDFWIILIDKIYLAFDQIIKLIDESIWVFDYWLIDQNPSKND